MTKFRLPSRFRVHTASFAAVVFLSACAGSGGSWTKANISPEAMASDVNECEFFGQAAGLSAAHQSNSTYTSVSSTGQMTTSQVPGTGALSFMEQGDAFARCMTARGYTRAASQ